MAKRRNDTGMRVVERDDELRCFSLRPARGVPGAARQGAICSPRLVHAAGAAHAQQGAAATASARRPARDLRVLVKARGSVRRPTRARHRATARAAGAAGRRNGRQRAVPSSVSVALQNDGRGAPGAARRRRGGRDGVNQTGAAEYVAHGVATGSVQSARHTAQSAPPMRRSAARPRGAAIRAGEGRQRRASSTTGRHDRRRARTAARRGRAARGGAGRQRLAGAPVSAARASARERARRRRGRSALSARRRRAKRGGARRGRAVGAATGAATGAEGAPRRRAAARAPQPPGRRCAARREARCPPPGRSTTARGARARTARAAVRAVREPQHELAAAARALALDRDALVDPCAAAARTPRGAVAAGAPAMGSAAAPPCRVRGVESRGPPRAAVGSARPASPRLRDCACLRARVDCPAALEDALEQRAARAERDAYSLHAILLDLAQAHLSCLTSDPLPRLRNIFRAGRNLRLLEELCSGGQFVSRKRDPTARLGPSAHTLAMASMSLLDGLKTAQFTLQVAHRVARLFAGGKAGRSADPTSGCSSPDRRAGATSAAPWRPRVSRCRHRCACRGHAAAAGHEMARRRPAWRGGRRASSHRARTVPAPRRRGRLLRATRGSPRSGGHATTSTSAARSVIEREQLRKRRRMRDASERRLAEYVRDGGLRAGYLLLRARAREAFDRIDTNGDGQLDVDEIKLMFEQLALDAGAAEDAALLTLGAVREMVDEFDDDGDGALGLDELCKLLAKYQAEHSSEAQLLRRRSSSARAARAPASEAKEALTTTARWGARTCASRKRARARQLHHEDAHEARSARSARAASTWCTSSSSTDVGRLHDLPHLDDRRERPARARVVEINANVGSASPSTSSSASTSSETAGTSARTTSSCGPRRSAACTCALVRRRPARRSPTARAQALRVSTARSSGSAKPMKAMWLLRIAKMMRLPRLRRCTGCSAGRSSRCSTS